MIACDGRPPHVPECYGTVELACPACEAPVRQFQLECDTQPTFPPMKCTPCALLCADCPSEVLGGPARWRVVHAAACPWLRRHLAHEVVGMIPCGGRVTHRGPYKRRPAA